MSDEIFVCHCSPTMAGIKVGNMFSCSYDCSSELMNYIRKLNNVLVPKGLRVIPLKYGKGRALIYVFRLKALEQVLNDKTARAILTRYGYTDFCVKSCINKLLSRFYSYEDFPHEVGLFLGYPPEDVYGFIENKAGGYKTVGNWKVYGDKDAAEKTFNTYKKCTASYCKRLKKGCSIAQLTVAG